ncbi:poly-gamma-glutamate capsule biosynthesis protein CapA/YwtB (metallophosphatase superfamily) [Mesorhizobium soli]|nr:poly-gamma-glutamate capsule biosynthesis protein CapA/YwtB (metallophosphatase superfamily) [Mesorhizobium soli]
MIGRGIDQIMANPCDPALHERAMLSATGYIKLAERLHGPIPRRVAPTYIWGVALEELRHSNPDACIVNLETSITRSESYIPKGINYRVSPENADCLVAAGIDCCTLANNHVLDWGIAGLLDTMQVLDRLHIKHAGAGRERDQASAPAVLDLANKGRVLVFSFASVTSGTPENWAATSEAPGVNVLPDLSEATATAVSEGISAARQPGDVIVASVHWGSNWGYEIPDDARRFAHLLIEKAGVSVFHGHSSHHPRAIEIYRNRLILHGCGDFVNDYEGIAGYEEFRDDLPLMYLVDIDAKSGDLAKLEIVPLRILRFRLAHPSTEDATWICQTLDRESRQLGTRVVKSRDGHLTASW